MAAKETLTIEVLTQQAQNNVNALNKSIGGLKTALGALAIGNLIRSTLAFADSINDTAKATQIATSNLLGFANVVQASGGSFADALSAANKFNLALGDLQAGSKKVNDALRQLGFTTEEIISDDTDAKFVKTIQRLSELEKVNKSLAASIRQDLFGKSLAPVSIDAGAFAAAAKEAKTYEETLQNINRAQDKLDRAFVKLQLSILKALEPLAEKLGKLTQEQVDQLVQSFIDLGKAAVSLVALGKVFSGIGAALGGLLTYLALFKTGLDVAKKTGDILQTQGKGFAKAWAAATTVFEKFKAVAYTIFIFLSKRLPYIIASLARMTPLILAITAALYTANEIIKVVFGVDLINAFISKVKEAFTAVTDFLGFTSEAERTRQAAMEAAAKAAEDAKEKAREQAEQLAINNQLLEEYKQNLSGTVQQVTDQNKKYIDQIKFLQDINNLSEDEQALATAKRNATEGSIQAIEELKRQQRELLDEAGRFKDLTLGAEKYKAINDAIAQIRAQLPALEAAAIKDVALQTQKRDLLDEQAQAVELLREQYNFDETQTQLQENLSLLELGRNEIEQATIEINRQRELRKVMYDFDLEMLKLEQRRIELGQERFQKEMQQLAELTQARIKSINAGAQAESMLADASKPQTWLEGWKTAYDDFIDNIPTAAERGKAAFETFTNGLTDAFVKFAQTGKLSFKDLLNNIIQQLVQSQIQNMIATIFNPGGAVGGTLTKIFGSIFGGARAEGGPVKGNTPYLVGEKGPELFMPKSAGTVVPNGQFGGGGQQITNNYITNQISAIDSKSVAQLFAENRKLLLGTVQMAQREMPT